MPTTLVWPTLRHIPRMTSRYNQAVVLSGLKRHAAAWPEHQRWLPTW
jgi:hypothetical protein